MDELFKRFEQLRAERWEIIQNLFEYEEDLDVFLADIANIVTLLFILKKVKKAQGFKSLGG